MLNVVALMGRFVADPELKQTSSGISVTNFRIAVDRSYVKAGSERQTDFIDVVAWRNTAEFVCKYFRKGQLVALQGSLQTRSYTDKDGNKRKAVEVIADNVHFAEPKRDGGANPGYQQRPQAQDKASAQNQQPAPAYSNGDTGDFEEIPSDDDLPF
ncbi:MAG TPA: single-stranded DNA-binding protein [Ruminococcaceae bacterium]|jgi:single-strand DNA-binding protein|nr:single-stranded DNA-binding protein [Oscillospiraceae bacterium]